MPNPSALIAPETGSTPDAVTILEPGAAHTREALFRRAGIQAARLTRETAPGDRCIVSLKNGPDFFAGIAGCWAAGVTPVILDPLLRSELAFAADMTGATRVIYSGDTPLPEGLVPVVPEAPTDDAPLAEIPDVDAQTPVLYLFTSGSTGRPTLVPKTFRQIEVEVDFIGRLFDAPRRVAGLVPWCHIWGLLSTFFVPLRQGGVCDLRSGISARGILEHAGVQELDLVVGVPVYYQAMVRVLEEGMLPDFHTSCRFASSSAPLSPEVRGRFKAAAGVGITDIFGSTETGGIAYRREDGPWIVQPHVEARIDDEGRLRVRSPSVSFETEDSFFAIGDLVESVAGGFVLLGREDDVVKIGGRRIALGEINRAVEACPGVFHAATVAENVAGTPRLLTYVEPKDTSLTSKAVKTFVRSKLADHKVPRTVHIVSSLPLTSSGKLDRRKLQILMKTSTEDANKE